MVGSEKNTYRTYFAASPSTDKTNGKSKPVSHTSSTANAIVDSPGNSTKAQSIAKSRSGLGADTSRRQESATNTTTTAPPSTRARVTRSTSGLLSPSATDSDTSSPGGSRDASPEPVSPAQNLLNKRKKEIVDKIMVEVFHPLFEKWLDQTIGAVSCAGEACDDDGSSGRSGETGPRGSDSKTPPKGQKRRLQRDDDEQDGDDPLDDGQGSGDGGGGGGSGRNGNKRARRSSDAKKLFACPYFKHNPAKYKTERTCCGPGWINVHRVKEHIYRKHGLPEFICPRCCKDLKTSDALRQHQRSETPCPLKKAQQLDGFDKHKEKLLRSRTNPSNERQKWEEMYRILFPGEPVPSPYYDDSSRADSKTTKFAAQYEEYLRRELPPLVEHDLVVEVGKQLNCVEDAMKIKVVEIFRNVQLKLLRTFTLATESDPEALLEEQSKKSKQMEGTPPQSRAMLSPRAETLQVPPDICDQPMLAELLDLGLPDFLQLQADNPLDLCNDSLVMSTDSGYGSGLTYISFGESETTSL